jgi:hypothetical protein
MPRQYRPGFWDEMVHRTLSDVHVLTSVRIWVNPEQTLHRWKHPALIDEGPYEGFDSTESLVLCAAHK